MTRFHSKSELSVDAPHIPGVLPKGLVDPNLNVAQYVFVYVYIYIHIQIDAILCMLILFQFISFHLKNGSKCTDLPLVGVFKRDAILCAALPLLVERLFLCLLDII